MYLDERTRYYFFRFSTICYGISVFLCTHYNFYPVNLQSHCDRCGTALEVMHALSCIIGGLVIAHHNKIRDKILYLSCWAFTSASLRAEPLIHQGRTRSELYIRQGSDNHKETRGGVMIRGLWNCHVDAIIDVKLGDTDADTYTYEPMTSLLTRWKNIKKDKHLKHCHNQRKHFPPFVISVDGMLGR